MRLLLALILSASACRRDVEPSYQGDPPVPDSSQPFDLRVDDAEPPSVDLARDATLPPGGDGGRDGGVRVTFAKAVGYSIASSTNGLLAADLDGDGNLDLAASDNRLSVLYGAGDGTFQAGSPVYQQNLQFEPHRVVARDLDGDGRTDLAVANLGMLGDLLVFKNIGNRMFQLGPPVKAMAGTIAFGLDGADFNRDGKLDFAMGRTTATGISILLASGGTYSASTVQAGTEPHSVVAADFDGDNNVDVATANQDSNDVTILLGAGNGQFQVKATVAAGTAPLSLVAADFDGDKRPDLAVSNGSAGTVTVLRNLGGGAFAAGRAFGANLSADNEGSLVAADCDGDGKIDLAVANQGSASVSVLLGNGDATFTQWPTAFGIALLPSALAAGDFNRDGRTDLAAPAGGGKVYVLLNGM